LAVTSVPSNVNCLRLTAAGSRTDVRALDVVPGASSTFTLSGLPTGDVTFSEQAFGEACASVAPGSSPTWISNTATATLVAGSPAALSLTLVPNGEAVITSDFKDGGSAGAAGDGAGGSSGAGGFPSGGSGGGCIPISQEQACGGLECGTVSDGCNGSYSCGTCPLDPCSPSTCTGGICVPMALPPCLTAGTPVAMADGTSKAIERVEVGDRVLAFDVATRAVRPQPVTQTYHHAAWENHDGMVLIDGTVHATGNHPVFANGRFVRADALAEGDALLELSGANTAARAIRAVEMSNGDVETFNLEVDGDHDYFAGGILVHNKPAPCP
jgi:hypothetical protein